MVDLCDDNPGRSIKWLIERKGNMKHLIQSTVFALIVMGVIVMADGTQAQYANNGEPVQINPNAPPEQQARVINQNLKQISDNQKTNILRDKSGNNRMLQGYHESGFSEESDMGVKASKPGKDVVTAEDSDLIMKDDLNTRIYYDGAGNSRVLIGKDSDFENNEYGIKVSQAGVDVTDATADQLVMSSDFNMFKVVASGTDTVTIANPATHYGTYTTSVAHDLGYKPMFIVYVSAPASLGSQLNMTPITRFDALGNFAFSAYAYTDTSNLTLALQPGTASAYDGTTWTFKYYLLRETAD